MVPSCLAKRIPPAHPHALTDILSQVHPTVRMRFSKTNAQQFRRRLVARNLQVRLDFRIDYRVHEAKVDRVMSGAGICGMIRRH